MSAKDNSNEKFFTGIFTGISPRIVQRGQDHPPGLSPYRRGFSDMRVGKLTDLGRHERHAFFLARDRIPVTIASPPNQRAVSTLGSAVQDWSVMVPPSLHPAHGPAG